MPAQSVPSSSDAANLPSDNDLSTLCRLEPRNVAAGKVIACNRHKTHRVVSLSTQHGASVEMLRIGWEEPKQRRGLAMFGRYPNCSVQFPQGQVSLDHCYIDLNPLSGILMLYDTSRHHTTWLDSQQVADPPYRAMVPHHAHSLRVHGASFQINWPKIAQEDLVLYQSKILSIAKQLHADREVFDLTDLEVDLKSLPPTAPGTRPNTRSGTPSNEPRDEGPIKLEELGRGVYGIVWKAVGRFTGEFLAVKQIRKTRDNTLLVREVKNMRSLRHTNIVRLTDWRESNTHVELDLEYCLGGSMRSKMNLVKTHLNLMFENVVAGLEHIHAQRLIHRDIKPDNILVQELDGELCFKLADFGFSNMADQAFTYCGSPLYMAPEICMRERQTSKVDVYSLGVVVLEVLGALRGVRMAGEKSPRVHREGLQPLIWTEVVDFRRGDRGFDLLRKMISRNGNRRPTATECLQFIKGDTAKPSPAPLRDASPKSDVCVQKRRPQPNLPADLLSDRLFRVAQDHLRAKEKRKVPQNDHPVVRDKSHHRKPDHPAVRDKSRHRKLDDPVPKVLKHQNAHDRRVTKKARTLEQSKTKLQMPGAWID